MRLLKVLFWMVSVLIISLMTVYLMSAVVFLVDIVKHPFLHPLKECFIHHFWKCGTVLVVISSVVVGIVVVGAYLKKNSRLVKDCFECVIVIMGSILIIFGGLEGDLRPDPLFLYLNAMAYLMSLLYVLILFNDFIPERYP